MPKSITFRAIKTSQPIGDFFTGVMKFSDVVAISYADVRRMEMKREVETYLGIQRPLSPARVSELRTYVAGEDATFPTAVILAIPAVCAVWSEEKGTLTLSEFVNDKKPSDSIALDRIAKILDGQHRIAGLATYTGEVFDIPVTLFVEADIAEQANIFATVNLAQTKVNRSLVYDLFELAKSRSPQKSCHNVAAALDRAENSPFHRRIKRLGVATEGRFGETLTQATFVDALMQYVSSSPKEDRQKFLRHRPPAPIQAPETRKLIFRNLFLKAQEDVIAKIIWSYFAAVADRWPEAWNSTARGNMLNRTNGFRAFMRFLRPCYLECVGEIGELLSKDKCALILKKISLKDSDFTPDRFLPGSSGEAELLRVLVADSGLIVD